MINLVPTIVLTRLGQLVNPYLIAAESQSFTPGRNHCLSINPLDSDGINMTLDFFLREAGERRFFYYLEEKLGSSVICQGGGFRL